MPDLLGQDRLMSEYHKINAPFKRYTEGPLKGKFIPGEWAMPEFKYLADNEWEGTEKVDGTNIRIYLRRDQDSLYVEFKGRSDNANIPKHLLAHLEETFPTSHPWARVGERDAIIGTWMIDHDLTDVTLYGEGYGPKIQSGGGNYRSDASFVLFDVKIGGFWLDRANVNDVAAKLGIDAVPVVGRGTLWEAIAFVTGRASTDFRVMNEPGAPIPMKSAWGDFDAEGLVIRPTVPLFTRKGERVITKIKTVDFR
jgi:hypothetical protein